MGNLEDRYDEAYAIEVAGSDEVDTPDALFSSIAGEVGSRFAQGTPFSAEAEGMGFRGEEGIWVSERAFERPFEGRAWVAAGGSRYAFGIEGRAYEYLDGGYRLLWARAEPEGSAEGV